MPVDGGISVLRQELVNQLAECLALCGCTGVFRVFPVIGQTADIADTDTVAVVALTMRTNLLNCNDHDFRAWRRRIREQIEADGQYITKLEITEKGLTLEAVKLGSRIGF